MKIFYNGKDGGPESTVTGYWLVELKPLFSIVLLKFEDGSREAYHNHAFHAMSWLIKGKLVEEFLADEGQPILPSWKPIFTSRRTFHRVRSEGTSWVLSFRGPWRERWNEYLPGTEEFVVLTYGRKRVA